MIFLEDHSRAETDEERAERERLAFVAQNEKDYHEIAQAYLSRKWIITEGGGRERSFSRNAAVRVEVLVFLGRAAMEFS